MYTKYLFSNRKANNRQGRSRLHWIILLNWLLGIVCEEAEMVNLS
jgi:hypothetical protein